MIEVAFVLSVIKEIPSECSLYKGQKFDYCQPGTSGHYERGKDTQEIAEAIARNAISRYDAIEMAVYAAYEGQNRLDATGDNGRSHGPWQTPFVRVSAQGYLADWIAIRARSIGHCTNNTPDTRLAALASGSCDRGLVKTAKRYDEIGKLEDRFSHDD